MNKNPEITITMENGDQIRAELYPEIAPNTVKNFINYSDEEYDKLYQQVKTSTDEEEQVELYKKMETLLCDDAANLYIEDMACEVALRSDFAGYQFYPLYVQDMAKIYKVK